MTTPHAHPLRIQTKYHWLSFMLAAFRPKATINGYEVPLNWGDNTIPAPPGRHEISVHVPYLWKIGRATTTVDNTAGSPAVYYAAPVWTWQRGAIGVQPQQPPGVTAAFVVYGLFFAGLLVCCLGTVLISGSNGT
jgi:hypothetical protein